jgi:hypothetical protein
VTRLRKMMLEELQRRNYSEINSTRTNAVLQKQSNLRLVQSNVFKTGTAD